ncbi:hypothetical protein [Jatrophihabitans sp.]|uniref:hypothetical protein n=1 Tax=Jatrophihabitans sp. TaxID=1932789 RepID=UPI0030C6A206|nr:hypothetical protein [Jatrophihabitans sp.]
MITHKLRAGSRAALAACRHLLAALVRLLRDAWAAHRHLLLNNAAYTTAVASVAAAVVTQATGSDVLAALLAGVLAIHRSLSRAITPY